MAKSIDAITSILPKNPAPWTFVRPSGDGSTAEHVDGGAENRSFASEACCKYSTVPTEETVVKFPEEVTTREGYLYSPDRGCLSRPPPVRFAMAMTIASLSSLELLRGI
jgi:hypothetical protein